MARFSVYSGSDDRDLSYHGVPRPAITSRASVESIDRGCGLSVRAESVIVQTAIFRDRRVGLARSPVRSDSLGVALCQQLFAQAVTLVGGGFYDHSSFKVYCPRVGTVARLALPLTALADPLHYFFSS